VSALAAAVALLLLELCLVDWRIGIYLVPVTGILQESLRKVVPGEPVAVVLLVGVVFAAAVAAMALRRRGLGVAEMLARFDALRLPLLLTVVWLVLQHLLTLVRFQNIPLLGIGVIFYFAPLVAIVVGYRFARFEPGSTRAVRAYLLLYAGMVAAAASGILLEFFGVESPLFKAVGPGIVLYGDAGVVKSYCGFFRSSEIAGWHIGAALCLLLALATAPGRRWIKVAAALVAPALVAAVFLTGRRKALMVLVLFLALYGFLMLSRRVGRRSLYPLLLLAAAGYALYLGDFFDLSSPQQKMATYLRRGGTVFEDAPQRFRLLGVNSVWWAVRDFGYFGIGAGVLGQGGQHFGGGSSVFGGSAEGGLGKITAELGVPGLLLFCWIGVLAAREAARLIRASEASGPDRHALTVGLIALVGANLPSFVVASQAFGDPFVILTLGLFVGFAAGIPQSGPDAGAAAAPEHEAEPAPGGGGGRWGGRGTRAIPRPWGRV
jgi:hypothetical protein